jgi:hypothetical protein
VTTCSLLAYHLLGRAGFRIDELSLLVPER